MQNSLFVTETTNKNQMSAENAGTNNKFPPLYNLDSKGKLRVWTIRVEDKSNGGALIVSEAGLIDGGKVKNEVPVTTGRNIGRSNETTPLSQAIMDARSKWESQKRSGYCEDPADCKMNTLGSGIAAPMLAHIYSPDGKVKGSKTLEKMKLAGERIHVQPKLDGVRCLAKITADSVELFTRKGDRMLPIPHIEEQLRRSFDENISNREKEFILDGELYSQALTFNALNGLLRREDKTAEQLEQLETVTYNLYDVMAEGNYTARFDICNGYLTGASVRTVSDYSIIATDAEIRKYMEEFLSLGYEGLMIRRDDTPYENRRSWSLLKYKDVQDAEYKIIDILEDVRGTGLIGAFVCELPEPVTDRDGKEIRTFNAGVKNLTHDESRRMLVAKQSYIGRFATIEFFERSEYSIPRFPKLKGFRSDV